MTLAEFLLARIADDEAAAGAAPAGADTSGQSALGDYLMAFPPSRVLAECEAKRRIVESYESLAASCDHMPWVILDGCCQCGVIAHALRALATIDADHPDYNEEWRP